MYLAVELLVDFVVVREVRLTGDDVLKPELRLHHRPPQLRSRTSALCIFLGRSRYRQRAQGACGRDSRTAPTKSRGVMNIPTSPVHTLPLRSTTTASIRVSAARAITLARATSE